MFSTHYYSNIRCINPKGNFLYSCFQHNNNNNKLFFLSANQNIRMISEGSCDRSNDAENSALKSEE